MKQTTNYKLNKPAFEDSADVEKLNENMDIIDKELFKRMDKEEAGKLFESKVDKDGNKVLSDENFTTDFKKQLSVLKSKSLLELKSYSGDLNSLHTAGMYSVRGCSNTPVGAGSYASVLILKADMSVDSSSTDTVQIYIDNSNKIFLRNSVDKDLNSWTGWREIGLPQSMTNKIDELENKVTSLQNKVCSSVHLLYETWYANGGNRGFYSRSSTCIKLPITKSGKYFVSVNCAMEGINSEKTPGGLFLCLCTPNNAQDWNNDITDYTVLAVLDEYSMYRNYQTTLYTSITHSFFRELPAGKELRIIMPRDVTVGLLGKYVNKNQPREYTGTSISIMEV